MKIELANEAYHIPRTLYKIVARDRRVRWWHLRRTREYFASGEFYHMGPFASASYARRVLVASGVRDDEIEIVT